MPREIDYELRATVVKSLEGRSKMSYARLHALAGGSDWNLRMALNYLVDAGVVARSGRKGVPCEYWLTGREFESGKPRKYDASGLMLVW